MPRKQISKKQELSWNDIPNNENLDDAKLEAARKSGELMEWDDEIYGKLLDDQDTVAKAFFSSLVEGEVDQAISILSHYIEHKKYKAVKSRGVAKSTLYDAFSKGANPTLKTLAAILQSTSQDVPVKKPTPKAQARHQRGLVATNAPKSINKKKK